MDSQSIKNQITDRINSIEDVILLEKIEQFLETVSNKDLGQLLDFVNDNVEIDKKDYNSYIKEWVKSM